MHVLSDDAEYAAEPGYLDRENAGEDTVSVDTSAIRAAGRLPSSRPPRRAARRLDLYQTNSATCELFELFELFE